MECRSQRLKQETALLPETLGDRGVGCRRGGVPYSEATAEPAGGPDAGDGGGFQQLHHQDGGKLCINVH